MSTLPTGVVTFLFSDVEGSTRILEGYGAATGLALERHFQIYERVVEEHHGVVFKTVGDAVYAAFAKPTDAVATALDAHREMARESWDDIGGRVACRIAIHTGSVERRGHDYFGAPLFRCARLQALAYGEQTVVSGVTARLVGSDLPPGARLVDRGVHRLKDLQEPEHVFELQHPDLRASFPPLKSLDARPHNLPMQISSFVGRESELASVKRLIDGHRLVTLLGPGGIGKTRLALQAAADQIEHFADGVWFVDLAPIRDPGMVADAVASVLGVREEADRLAFETLLAHVRARNMLLVLDNLEQLLPGAARTVSELVGGAPGVHVVATSRGPLRVRGEVEYEVPPLGAGDPERSDASVPGAVALFLERAHAIRPELEVDRRDRSAHRGDLRAAGRPAAGHRARSCPPAVYSLQALHDRLDQRLPVLIGGARDLPERQQTLRAAIAWSDELLAEPERDLFWRLGVFAGSFSLDGATAVAGPDLGTDAEAGLTILLEESLVRRLDGTDEPRFTMLETIREYAWDRLTAEGGADAARDRLADHVDRIAHRANDELVGLREAALLRLLDTELPNVRSTLE